jgi:hypothetical protein
MDPSDQPNPVGTPQDVLDWGIQGAADPHAARVRAASIALGMLTGIRGDAGIAALRTSEASRPAFELQEDRALSAWCVAQGAAFDPHYHGGLSTRALLTFGAIDVVVICWRTDDELLEYARDLARARPCSRTAGPWASRGPAQGDRSPRVLQGPRPRSRLPLDVARRACESEAGLEDAVLVYVNPNTARVDLDGLRRRVRA